MRPAFDTGATAADVSDPTSNGLRRLLREPLVHFLGLGALLFALDAARAPEPAPDVTPATPERRIVIDEGVRRAAADTYRHEHGEDPPEDELAARIDRWVDEEILYREGLARGLTEGDERIRMRVVQLMADVLDAEQPVPAPTDDEIAAYFDAHRERWDEPARIDFVHVFVSGETEAARARAEGLLAQLSAGASPQRMGDTFSGGRHYRGRRVEQLAESFGQEFAGALDALPPGTWSLVRSRFGWHVVRIEARSDAHDASLAAARADVIRAIELARRAERADAARAELRARWEVVEAP